MRLSQRSMSRHFVQVDTASIGKNKVNFWINISIISCTFTFFQYVKVVGQLAKSLAKIGSDCLLGIQHVAKIIKKLKIHPLCSV